MSAAQHLIIVENSGSLDGLVNASLIRDLEALAEAPSGCSVAFQTVGAERRPLGVKFFQADARGVEALNDQDDYQKALGGGGGGTYLSELFGLALAEHVRVHGQKPSQIVYWSDFCDQPPTRQAIVSQSGPHESELDLTGVDVVGVVVGDDNGSQAKAWGRELAKETGAFFYAVPHQAVKAQAEAKAIEEASAQATSSRPAIRV